MRFRHFFITSSTFTPTDHRTRLLTLLTSSWSWWKVPCYVQVTLFPLPCSLSARIRRTCADLLVCSGIAVVIWFDRPAPLEAVSLPLPPVEPLTLLFGLLLSAARYTTKFATYVSLAPDWWCLSSERFKIGALETSKTVSWRKTIKPHATAGLLAAYTRGPSRHADIRRIEAIIISQKYVTLWTMLWSYR